MQLLRRFFPSIFTLFSNNYMLKFQQREFSLFIPDVPKIGQIITHTLFNTQASGGLFSFEIADEVRLSMTILRFLHPLRVCIPLTTVGNVCSSKNKFII